MPANWCKLQLQQHSGNLLLKWNPFFSKKKMFSAPAFWPKVAIHPATAKPAAMSLAFVPVGTAPLSHSVNPAAQVGAKGWESASSMWHAIGKKNWIGLKDVKGPFWVMICHFFGFTWLPDIAGVCLCFMSSSPSPVLFSWGFPALGSGRCHQVAGPN